MYIRTDSFIFSDKKDFDVHASTESPETQYEKMEFLYLR